MSESVTLTGADLAAWIQYKANGGPTNRELEMAQAKGMFKAEAFHVVKEIIRHSHQHETIYVIKHLRALFSIPLKDAKDIVDDCFRGA
jgi:ribosomal protein L7/L12